MEHIANDNGLVLISDETEGGHPVHVRSLKDVEEGFEGSATEEPTSLIQVRIDGMRRRRAREYQPGHRH